MPVRAWPMTSVPASAIGRVSAWIGNGCDDAGLGKGLHDQLVDAEGSEICCLDGSGRVGIGVGLDEGDVGRDFGSRLRKGGTCAERDVDTGGGGFGDLV